MEALNDFVTIFNSYLWGLPMIIVLLGTHLFLTIRLRFPQRYIFKAIRLSVTKDNGSKGDVSQFSTLATSLAGTIGTGNIIGVATAVAMGGPGAVFWCWMTGVLGISTKYTEAMLAVKYRVKAHDGKMLGGPMYTLERGLKCRWMAIAFCILTLLSSFFIGNMIQCNSIATVIHDSYGVSTQMTGGIVALLTAGVVVFGVKGITKVCSRLVPFMTLVYLAGCIILLVLNHNYLIPAISLIMKSAFSGQAAAGGFVGSTVIVAMRYGTARGLFSNEAGMGSAPIVAAAAQTRNSVRQALVTSTTPFWDTVVICAITGLVVVSSILANPSIDSSGGALLTKMAFAQIPYVGKLILTSGIATFAFSTVLGWNYIGEKALEYLVGKKARPVYRFFSVLATYVGSVSSLALVWNLGDMMNGLMTIPNVLSLLLLSGVAVKETRHYLWENHLDEEDASPIMSKQELREERKRHQH